jgi:uncharacterized membrane protein YkvA (DUF1232 family)
MKEGQARSEGREASRARFWGKWRARARALRADTYALYLAYKDPRVPWYAKLFAGAVVAYAFCPLDLIPDFVPVLGYLDDLVLVPLGIAIALRMIPAPVLAESRSQARERLHQDRPTNWVAAIVILLLWLLAAGLAALVVVRLF